eukprot:XP_001706293.1 Hypothetical protein GL50803_113571 [Giardia lamblia ATCC 50803]
MSAVCALHPTNNPRPKADKRVLTKILAKGAEDGLADCLKASVCVPLTENYKQTV